ncbi:hypothetical protein JCM19238_259 [Vibrio ponticus]|nr:hypothetical protein JCM19238_259 [Vibrio ponticus]
MIHSQSVHVLFIKNLAGLAALKSSYSRQIDDIVINYRIDGVSCL